MTDPRQLVGAVEAAAAAIGRLDQALTNHPLRPAWEHRRRIAAAVQASAWDGRAVDPTRLAAMLAGAPVASLPEREPEIHAVRFIAYLGLMVEEPVSPYIIDDPADYLAEFETDTRLFRQAMDTAAAVNASALAATAEAAWLARREPDARPGALHAAVPRYLTRRGLSRRPLTGLAVFPGRQDHDPWIRAFIHRLGQAAEAGLAQLNDLTLRYTDGARRIGRRSKNSRLLATFVAALCRPALTPAGVSSLFGVTLPGASKLLGELVALGLLADAVDRGSHRLYVCPDLGIERTRRLGRMVPPAHAPSELTPALDELLDGINAAIFRSDRLLARHGIAKARVETDPSAEGTTCTTA